MLFRLILFALMGFCAAYCAFPQNSGDGSLEIYTGMSPYFGQELPGPKPELFAPEIFNHTEGYHSPVVFSNDLTEAFWSPMDRDHSLLYSELSDGVWSKPVALSFGLSRGIGDPFFWRDGTRLYFLSYEPPHGSSGPERERLWYTQQVNGEWEKPVCLDPLLARHPTHWKGSASDQGTLFFTSEINVDVSGQDIYYALFRDGHLTSPQAIGNSVNTNGWEFGPCIAPDESFLIFTRRDNITRKTDLYISFKSGEGGWSTAVELSPGINSDENDLCPSLSPDGKYMFFLSTREGNSRIYWVEIAGIIESLMNEN